MISKDDIDAMAHTKEQKEYWEVPMTEVDLLKKNVRDLQEQLQDAYKRIKELSERE